MISAQIIGGLGNQLFIIFHAIAQSIRINQPFIFIQTDSHGGDTAIKRYTYWDSDSFLHKLKKHLIKEYPPGIEHQSIKERGFPYSPLSIPVLPQAHTDCIYIFEGYFQSYKYFKDVFDQICEKIGVKDHLDNILPWFQTNGLIQQNTISMHFRIGDYRHLQHYHPIMSYEYYENSLQTILEKDPIENPCILYFCEEPDLEEVHGTIHRLQSRFPQCTYVYINEMRLTDPNANISDWQQMMVMSLCKHNIIANSTFSWWGAYFNPNETGEQIVCYPDTWFGPGIPVNTDDLFPANWYREPTVTL